MPEPVVRGNSSGRTSSTTTVKGDKSGRVISLGVYSNKVSEPKCHGFAQGIAFSAPTTIDGAGSFGRHMQVGVNQDTTQGSPSPPSLRLDFPGNMWRFRWVTKEGARSISVLSMQNSTGSYRPSMIIKANPNIGLNNDLSASAANGSGWVNIGPIMFTSLAPDVVWVELHNNNYGLSNLNASGNPEFVKTPAYFDHIIIS
jgi:hypothetical protein